MRLLLIDDHTLFREGLSLILSGLRADLMLLQAGSCEEAAELANADEQVDLILLDMKLPGVSGVAALKMIRAMFAGTRVIIVSGECTPQDVNAAIEAGAMGYIPKTSSPNLLMSALGVVMANGVYLPAEIMLAARASGINGNGAQANAIVALTDRQCDVLRLLVEGAPNKRIARLLDISEATVKTHLAAVFRLLDVHNRTEAVYAAARLGLNLESLREPAPH